MIKFKERNTALYILNGIAVFVYLIIFLNLNITVCNEIVFSTPDALTYLDVANWLDVGLDSESISTRPILYPIILLISTKLGGAYGIWIIQVIFWLLTINFTFLAIKRYTKSYIYAFIGAFIIMVNLSLIALTLHALTEVTVVFLLSAMLFFIVKKIEQFKKPHFIHTCLFFLVLLSIVKPVFSIPMFGVLFFVLPIFYLRKHLKYPRHFLRLFLILLPLLVQLTIIKTKYDQTKISLIASMAFTKYFVPQGIQIIESVDREDAVKKALSFSRKKQLNYIYEHLSAYSELFISNIIGNIKGEPSFLLYPKGLENYQFADFMKTFNKITVYLHYLFSILILPLLLILLKKKKYHPLILLSSLYTLGVYYIVSTGISFWQGYRLVLPAIAIWACLYPLILFSYLELLYPIKPKLH